MADRKKTEPKKAKAASKPKTAEPAKDATAEAPANNFQMAVAPAVVSGLQETMKFTKDPDVASAMSKAIMLYNTMAKLREDGMQILAKAPDGKVSVLRFHYDPPQEQS